MRGGHGELFRVVGTTDVGDVIDIAYRAIDDAIKDPGLEAIFELGAKLAAYSGGARVTRDVSTWHELRRQIVLNAANLLRGEL